MSTKTRIQKLESVTPGQAVTDNRQLKRVIGADGNKFYIDGLQVDYEIYIKAERAQMARDEDKKIHVTILGLDEEKDGDG